MADGPLTYDELEIQNSQLRRQVDWAEGQRDELLGLLSELEDVVLAAAHRALVQHVAERLRKRYIKQPYEGKSWGPIKREETQ